MLVVVCGGIGILLAAALGPPILIPIAVASSAGISGGASPGAVVTVGDWGYPRIGDYFKGRGSGHDSGIRSVCSYCGENHRGYDMGQGCGTTIYAAGPGVVSLAGSNGGFGNAVVIEHGGGLTTIYGHMEWGSLRVGVDDAVTAGTPLGAEGDTGNSFGCHLHFEVRVDDVAVSPEDFMAQRGLPLK